MAEAMMSRTGIFSPSTSIHRQYPCPSHGLSVFPTQSAMFSSGTGIGIGFSSLKLTRPIFLRSSSLSSFNSNRVFEGIPKILNTRSSSSFVSAQMRAGIIGKTQKWWEKGLQPNMMELKDAQDLVESLLNAGDKLVIVDFFSPGCGGCKSLHPKICQLAEINPDVQFLQVNYEEHKSMCYTLNVHVLPFFRFYRGSHGRLCSFSCTNATIKKFKDALAKHSPERCSLGPPKGLEEKELLALAANKDLSFNFDVAPSLKPETAPAPQEILIEASPLRTSLPSVRVQASSQDTEKKKALVTSRRRS